MHAYLIIAHKYDRVFEVLLSLLDDPRNDIFVHVDKKCKSFPFDEAQRLVSKSNLTFTDRIKVTWGGSSLIWAELILLKAATAAGNYEYYHLLSGEDLPLKPQDEIHAFFSANKGKEFVQFESDEFKYESRVYYYHIGQNFCGKYNRDVTVLKRIVRYIRKKLVRLQEILHKVSGIHRHKNIAFRKGAQWFSITDKLARYVTDNEQWIRNAFKYTYCGDEIFLQTLVHNSSFKESLYRKEYDYDNRAIMRLITWEGSPHVFTIQDKDQLLNTDMLFARKFQDNVSRETAGSIFEIVKDCHNCSFLSC